MADFQKTLRVDASAAGDLSLSFTVVLVETYQKHPKPETCEDYVLKYLPRAFISTSNDYRKTDSNKAFCDELKRTYAQTRNTRRGSLSEGSCVCARD
jgi:hypothetical protein